MSSPAQVFGINTVTTRKEPAADGQEDSFSIIKSKDLESVFTQEHLSKEKVIQKVREILEKSSSLRGSLFRGWSLRLHTLLEA